MLHMLDFFYFEEHLVIVSELLGDNLYEFSKAVKEAGHPEYFTLPRVCKITRQCLEVRDHEAGSIKLTAIYASTA